MYEVKYQFFLHCHIHFGTFWLSLFQFLNFDNSYLFLF